eukprot:gene42267-47370_t
MSLLALSFTMMVGVLLSHNGDCTGVCPALLVFVCPLNAAAILHYLWHIC